MARREARSVLELRDARLQARIGWERSERLREQPIELSLRLEFSQPPRACETDQLDHTVCYAELLERARKLVASREFRLIEHLAHALCAELRPLLPDDTALELTVRKPQAPLPTAHGGVFFTLRC